jgi:DNA-binding transcriptional regulator YiaG
MPNVETSAAAKRKPGRPKKAVAKRSGAPVKPGRKKGSAPFDVKALRSKLGASRNALAKLLGVSAGSILNWELRATTITAKNVAKLEALAARAAKGQVTLPERKKGGRPRKTATLGLPVPHPGRPPKVRVEGSPENVLYANVVEVTQATDGNALIRLALVVPGEPGARAVADVVVPGNVLATLRR